MAWVWMSPRDIASMRWPRILRSPDSAPASYALFARGDRLVPIAISAAEPLTKGRF